MNELDFNSAEDTKGHSSKGPVKPLTPQMMAIAANPSQGWRTQHFLDRQALLDEKAEERKVKWARSKCRRIMAEQAKKEVAA